MAPADQRMGRPTAVADLLPRVGGTAFRRFGFVQGALVTHWRQIVGPGYARWSLPQSLRCARRREGGVLTIRVEGPFACQLQHLEPEIVARANRVLGRAQVTRIRIVQGPLPRATTALPAACERPPSPALPNLRAIADPELRAALERLAAALSAAPEPPRMRNA